MVDGRGHRRDVDRGHEGRADRAGAEALAGRSGGRPRTVPAAQKLDGGRPGEPLSQHVAGAPNDLRIHTSPEAQRASRLLGARAFSMGRDLFFGQREDVRAGSPVLAHEVGHAVQGGGELETFPDPANELTEIEIAALSDPDLTSLEGAAETMYGGATDKLRPIVWANIAAIHREMRKRNLPIKQIAAAQTTTIVADQGTAAEVASLQMMVDVLLQELTLQLSGPESTNLIAWLKNERTVITNIAQSAVLREGDLLEDMMKGLEQVIMVRAAVPETESTDAATAAAQRGVTQGIKGVLDELQTPLRGAALKDLLAKLDAFTDAYSANLVRALADTQKRVAASPSAPDDETPTPDFQNDDAFIRGLQWEGAFYFSALWDELSTFQMEKSSWLDAFTKLAAPAAGDPVDKRLAFMKAHEAEMTKTMQRGGAIVLLGAALSIGRSFMSIMTEASDLVIWSDVAKAQRVRGIAVKLAHDLEADNFDDLTSLQTSLKGAAEDMKERFEDAKDYLSKVNTMVKIGVIVASLFTGGEASTLAMGSEAATFGTSAMTTSTLLRGALAFSLVSQATTIAMTGQVPSWKEMALQTGMDVVTMGMMHAVNLRLAGIYGTPAAVPVGVKITAEFTAMWAWSTSVGFAMQGLDPKAKQQSLGAVALDSVKHTLIGFAAMGVVHKASELPKFDNTSAPDPVLAAQRAAAIARYDQLRIDGKALDTEYQKIMDAEDPKALDEVIERVEKWYGEVDGSLKELADAGLWDEAAAKAMSAQLKTDIASIHNARDAVRLGLRATSGRTLAYSGDPRNAEMFLNRLKSSGGIKDFSPIEKGGMYRVTQADGSVTIWYPEAGTTEAASGVDFASQYLLDAHPELSAETAAHVMDALKSAPGADVGKLIDLISSPSGQKVLTWLSHPETAAALKASARGGELVGFVLDNTSLQDQLETSGKDLVTWNDLPYESIYGRRGGFELGKLLTDVVNYRGSISADLATAKATFAELRDTKEAGPFSQQSSGGYYAIGQTPKLGADDYMRDYVRANKLDGELHQVDLDGGSWFLRTQDGKLVDGYFFAAGATVPTVVDIASAVSTLEQAKADLAADPKQKDAISERVAPSVKALDFLRRVRGIDDAHINDLLDTFEARPATAPVEIKPADPAPAPPPEVVPVTTKKVRSKARDEILGQADRMGLTADKVPAEIEALQKWNPADPTTAPADIEAALSAARDVIAKELARAKTAARDYYGAGNLKKIRAEFATEAQADEALRLVLGKHARSPEMMHGMALATKPNAGEIGSPIPLEKIFANAPTARDARVAFEVYGKLRDAGIPGADRLFRDMAKTPSDFRGGMYTLRAIADGTIPIEDVRSLETEESVSYEIDGEVKKVVREHDVVLKNLKTIEMKAWTYFRADKVSYQFGKDAVLRTNKFTAPEGLRESRWIFEKLPNVTEGNPPRTRTMTEPEARAAILASMEQGVRDWGKKISATDEQINDVIKKLHQYSRTIINVSRFE